MNYCLCCVKERGLKICTCSVNKVYEIYEVPDDQFSV